jgi:hypothetical protein
VTAAVIASIAALVGVLVGQVLTRGTEYRKWLRQESHVACAKVLNAAAEIHGDSVFHAQLDRQLDSTRLERIIFEKLSSATGEPTPNRDSAIEQLLLSESKKVTGRIQETILKELDAGGSRRITLDRSRRLSLGLAVESVSLLGEPKVAQAAMTLKAAAFALQGVLDEVEWNKREALYVVAQQLFVVSARQYLHAFPWYTRLRGRKARAQLAEDLRDLLHHVNVRPDGQGFASEVGVKPKMPKAAQILAPGKSHDLRT